MRHPLGNRLCILFVSLVVFGVALASLPVLSQQDCGDGTSSGALEIQDALDLAAFVSNLSQPTLASQVKSQLNQGKPCRELGFQRTAMYQNGDRDYCGGFLLRGSQSNGDLVNSVYEYSHLSGASPEVPPDDFAFTTQSIASSANGVILPDAVSYDFLVYVLNGPPGVLLQHLSGKQLTELWVEHIAGLPGLMKLFLKFTGNGTTETVLVLAPYLGGINFGPLTIVE